MNHSPRQTNSTIIPGITGGLVFLLFLFIFNFSFFISILAALGSFFAVMLLFLGNPEIEFKGLDPQTTEFIKETMDEGYARLNEINALLLQIKEDHVKGKVKEIINTIIKIFTHLKKDPEQIRIAKRFLHYYLDATVNIIRKYVDISNENLDTPEIINIKIKVDNVLEIINTTFKKQLGKLMEDDLLDLESEISVLETTIKSGGL